MGSVLASKIAADAAKLLFDPNYTRFTEANHLTWINAGQRQAAIFKPDISVVNGSIQLVAGTKQSVASGDLGLIKILRNMGTDGATPGRGIQVVDMDRFTRMTPNWHRGWASAEVEVYMYDEKDPKNFYVYPPQPSSGQGYVERVAPVLPADITDIGDAINIDDVYEHILLNYDLYRGYMVNAVHSSQARSKAVTHWNLFVSDLGRRDLIEKVYSPNIGKKEGNNGA